MASQIRTLFRMAPAAAVALSLGSMAVTPARAADDGQESFFSAVAGMLGGTVGVEKETAPPIDYRERAPLVVPPKTDLPKPLPPASARNTDWPETPEIRDAKKAAEDAKAPRGIQHPTDGPISVQELRVRGTLDPNGKPPTDDCLETHTCDPTAFWNMLKNTKKQDTQQLSLIPGQEPPREYLTQPPPGYLSATKEVKVIQSAPRVANPENDPEDNPAVYFRDQKQSQYSPE